MVSCKEFTLTFSYGGRKHGTTLRDSLVTRIYKNIWILYLSEVLTTKNEDGNIHDRFVCDVYLRAAFILLAVDVGGGVYSRVAFAQVLCLGWRGGGGNKQVTNH